MLFALTTDMKVVNKWHGWHHCNLIPPSDLWRCARVHVQGHMPQIWERWNNILQTNHTERGPKPVFTNTEMCLTLWRAWDHPDSVQPPPSWPSLSQVVWVWCQGYEQLSPLQSPQPSHPDWDFSHHCTLLQSLIISHFSIWDMNMHQSFNLHFIMLEGCLERSKYTVYYQKEYTTVCWDAEIYRAVWLTSEITVLLSSYEKNSQLQYCIQGGCRSHFCVSK